MKYIVYQTINLKNNKIYIGVHATQDENIFDGYIGCGIKISIPSSYMNPITPLQFAVKKYGTSLFKRTTIKAFDTVEEAFDLEKVLVNQEFINRNDTYNAKIGGLGGSSYYRKINQFDLSGNMLKNWESIKDAADFYSVSHTAIANAIKYNGSCKKYFWSDLNQIDIKKFSHSEGQICYKYSSDGKYIEMYNSFTEAANVNNKSLPSIQRAIQGGYKCGEFFYSTEVFEKYTGKNKLSIKNKSLYIYNLGGEFIKELKNSAEIYEFFNITSTSSLTTAMRSNKPYKGFQISLTFENTIDPVQDKRNIRKKVVQYNLVGDQIQIFDSMTAACNIFGTGVQKVLKGQQQQCKNFIFRYLE